MAPPIVAHDYKPRFAPVAPPNILRTLFDQDPRRLFGGYHLFLAHLCADPKLVPAFQDLLIEWAKMRYFDPLTIIMDNSIVELGGSINHEVMLEAVTNVDIGQARIIPVLPDVMGEGQYTLDAIQECYADWKANVPHPHGFMAVLQGRTFSEFRAVADFLFIRNPGKFSITWAGIPRMHTHLWGDRKESVRYIQMIAPWVKIHLLGFSDNLLNDFEASRLGVDGIDSAVPVRYEHLLTPSTNHQDIGSRKAGWMEGRIPGVSGIQAANIMNVRSWIGQEHF